MAPSSKGEWGTPSPATESDRVALVFEKVCKTFGKRERKTAALREVSFDARPKCITGLVGPDGAGKTTLMRLAAGLLSPDSGRIEVLGIDVLREPLAVQAAIGYMPQRFGLYEDLTVQENLDLYADLQGVIKADRRSRYEELMHMTGLAPFTARLAGRLSGGMKQKLGLACTLVRPPRLLLLDEPTVGVDPVSRRELWSIVVHLVSEEGMSVLLSTAYLDEVERCEDVVLMHEGEVLGQASPGDFTKPLHGRTYAVTAPNMKKRAVQEGLVKAEGVLDAVIHGDTVRLVMQRAEAPVLDNLLPEVDDATAFAVEPRFEDAYITSLKERIQREEHPVYIPSLVRNPRNPDDDKVIEVRDVQRKFGDFYAVKGISFEVRMGEVFGLLGANGAGKSTTFRMLCGLLPASAGALRVAGKDLRRAAAAARARIGYMSQKFSLYGNLSVYQNLLFFSSAYGLKRARRAERLEWAQEQFQLAGFADATSSELPLGYKQRLALACALMHEPEILFLDEPTSGVDPVARREFWGHINAFAQSGVTVLVTTHFMEEAEYCDRLAIMAAGEILALGIPAEIKAGARSKECPEPTMEDAFISLIERHGAGDGRQ